MPTPLPVLPGRYYAHVSCTYLGLPTGNIFTFEDLGPGLSQTDDFAHAQTLADSLAARWSSEMLPLYPTAVSGVTARVYALGHAVLPAALGSVVGGGSNGTDVAPVSCAAVVRHAVTRRGRGSQSHSALSPLPASAITADGKSLNAGPRGALQSAFSDFIAAVVTDYVTAYPTRTIDYVQLSKKSPGATYPITSSSVEDLLGTERSRTPRP